MTAMPPSMPPTWCDAQRWPRALQPCGLSGGLTTGSRLRRACTRICNGKIQRKKNQIRFRSVPDTASTGQGITYLSGKCVQSLRTTSDNAYAESLFRTAKYRPEFPAGGFADLEAARAWATGFVHWYNVDHRQQRHPLREPVATPRGGRSRHPGCPPCAVLAGAPKEPGPLVRQHTQLVAGRGGDAQSRT